MCALMIGPGCTRESASRGAPPAFSGARSPDGRPHVAGEPLGPLQVLLHAARARRRDLDAGAAGFRELADLVDHLVLATRGLRLTQLAVRVVLDVELREGHDHLERLLVAGLLADVVELLGELLARHQPGEPAVAGRGAA